MKSIRIELFFLLKKYSSISYGFTLLTYYSGSGGTRTPKPLRPDLQSGEPTNCSTLPFLILYWTRTNLCGITAVLPLDEQKSFTCFGLQPSSFKLCYRRTIENCSSLFPPPNIVAPCRLELQPRVCNTPTLPLRHGAIITNTSNNMFKLSLISEFLVSPRRGV